MVKEILFIHTVKQSHYKRTEKKQMQAMIKSFILCTSGLDINLLMLTVAKISLTILMKSFRLFQNHLYFSYQVCDVMPNIWEVPLPFVAWTSLIYGILNAGFT